MTDRFIPLILHSYNIINVDEAVGLFLLGSLINVVASVLSVSPTLSANSFALIVLTVEDANDQPPIFTMTSYTFQVPEDTPINSRFEMISTSDGDTPPNARIEYTSTLVSKFKVQTIHMAAACCWLKK